MGDLPELGLGAQPLSLAVGFRNGVVDSNVFASCPQTRRMLMARLLLVS